MSKYFKEVYKEKKLLSDYLKTADEADARKLEYLIKILGDVKLEEDMMKMFCGKLSSSGGRYSVMDKPETIKAMYGFTRKFRTLSPRAIDEIWFKYISDLYEEYDYLETLLQYYIEFLGKEDDTFESFIKLVDEVAEAHQKKYEEEALGLKDLEGYSESFILHLKSLIIRQHYTLDEIKKYLPSAELVTKDEQHLSDIASKTRIFFGCCLPVSYTMFEVLLETKTLDGVTETPTYYISKVEQEKATFTKAEFLESIKVKQKVLKQGEQYGRR